MQAIQTRNLTPIEEARQLRAEALRDLQALRTEYPHRAGWTQAMQVLVGNLSELNGLVAWLEARR